MNPSVHGNGLRSASRSAPPTSWQAAAHARGANAATSMSVCEAMWTDGRAQLAGSSLS